MMKITSLHLFCLFLLSVGTHCAAQTPSGIQRLPVDVQRLPAGVTVTGQVVHAEHWQDKAGEHLLLLSLGPVVGHKPNTRNPDGYHDQNLYGYQFSKQGGSFVRLWQVQDFVRECEFDLTCDFLLPSVQLTDLNNDGIAETSFLYKIGCRSDISPVKLKLIMHNGTAKYVLRGETQTKDGTSTYGGTYKPDPAFTAADARFLAFARQQWPRFAPEAF
jgi:hypothetical protein